MPPDPQEHRLIHDPEAMPEIRRLDCRSYNACLTLACRQRWDGFHCNACSAHDPRSRAELREDLEGLAGVLLNLHPLRRRRSRQ